jgi:hypothetical protein
VPRKAYENKWRDGGTVPSSHIKINYFQKTFIASKTVNCTEQSVLGKPVVAELSKAYLMKPEHSFPLSNLILDKME